MDLILIKYLQNILQYGDDHASLQPGVCHVVSLMRAHDRRSTSVRLVLTKEGCINLRPTNTQIGSAHPIDLGRLLYAPQMQHNRSKRGVVGIRERVDQRMHRVPPHRVVVDACCIDELCVEFPRQKRVGKLPEKLFQQTSNTIDVVLKSLGIAEVDLTCICWC